MWEQIPDQLKKHDLFSRFTKKKPHPVDKEEEKEKKVINEEANPEHETKVNSNKDNAEVEPAKGPAESEVIPNNDESKPADAEATTEVRKDEPNLRKRRKKSRRRPRTS